MAQILLSTSVSKLSLLNQKWVYGRGAIDDKHSVFGILEALEYMARREERPERTLYVAFGHDEASANQP